MKRFLIAAALAALVAHPGVAAEPTGTLKKIKDTGTLVLGHRDSSPPFSFVGGHGKPAGYSVDVCLRVANSIQRQLGLPRLDVKWVKVAVDTRIPAVVNGTIDLECGSTTATLGRHEQVDFSFITFVDGGGLLATRASGIRGVGDLGGKRVAVIPGTTTEGARRRFNLTAIRDPQEIHIKHFLDSLTCLLALRESPLDHLIDVGTGAGFPGIPIRILYPKMQLTLVESVGKKAQFCRHVVNILDLQGVDVVQGSR